VPTISRLRCRSAPPAPDSSQRPRTSTKPRPAFCCTES
jgi:hypothetical protein